MTMNVKSQDQTDNSDSLWSIVMPQYSAKDIDMGKVIINNYKDSNIINFVINTGTYKFNIQKIYFSGTDKNSFQLISGIPPFVVDNNSGSDVEIRFSPKKVGFHNALINIITQADTFKVKISGEGVNPQIQIINNTIDFGTVIIGKYKDTIQALTIKNIGTNTLTILNTKHNKPNDIDFTTLSGGGSFMLLPGEEHKMNLRFNPTSIGRTNGILEFIHDGVAEKVILQLFGIGKLSPKLLALSPICIGDDIYLSTDSIADAMYYWSGPDGFKSNNRNVVIKNAQLNNSGKYYLYVLYDGIASDTLVVDVLVNQFKVSPNDNTLGFKGSTERNENFIKLTNSRLYDYGAVWLKDRFSFTHDFETTFEFNVTKGSNGTMEENSIPGADGFAFVIQNRDNPVLGKKGGDIGYTGFSNSLAVEIDLYQNEYDPNGNHIAVQSMGFESNIPDHTNKKALLGINDKILTILKDSIYYVKIQYEWKNKRLRVFIDSTPNLIIPHLEVYGLNLVDLLGLENVQYGYIGFTSATGAAYQEHNIYNWVVPCKNNTVDVNDNYISDKYSMSVNPNPVEGTMNINLNLPHYEFANLVLCDLNGRVVKTILNRNTYSPINNNLSIDINDLSVGMYLLKLQTSKFADFQKILIIK
jgi:hypothetical protein